MAATATTPLHGGAGADQLIGGDVPDFANYQGSTAGVTIDLLAGTASGGDAAGDVLTSIENLYGSSNDDHLTGSNDRNIIGSELGNDTILGHGGDDTLSGEAGDDTPQRRRRQRPARRRRRRRHHPWRHRRTI